MSKVVQARPKSSGKLEGPVGERKLKVEEAVGREA